MENYILANCTDTGKVRYVNEDSMTTFDSPNGRVVVVCDGMGGQNAGDVASQLAVSVIQDILTDNAFPTPEDAIARSIIAANQAILRRASQDENLSGMGATCVMVIVKDGKVYYGSVGDSRIYYISGGMIRQITKDQSYVQTLVDEGKITQEAAEHHQDKNQITNALGIEGMTPPVVCQMPISPEPGSVFLLCSDGLSGMINNNTILATVSQNSIPLNERAMQLVNQANAAGGLDNITVQLIEFPMGGVAVDGSRMNPKQTAYVNKKKKNGHKGLILTICLLLVALTGGGAYWWFYRDVPKPEPKNEMKPKVQAVSPAKETKKEVSQKQEVIDVKETVIIKKEAPEKVAPKKVVNQNQNKNNNNNNALPLPGNKIDGKSVTGKGGTSASDDDLYKMKMNPFKGNKEEE